MSRSKLTLDQIFEAQLQTLALTMRHSTVVVQRSVARRFLSYLHSAFPQVHRVAQLRRDPHLLAGSVGYANRIRPYAT